MMKEALVIGGSAAAGTWISQKYGAALEAQAVKLSIPPMVAHMAVVGGFTAISYFIVKRFV